MTGADTKEEAKNIVKLVSSELEKVGFNLRKWISNIPEIIVSIENSEENKVLCIEENESIKTLGLQWDPNRDEFKFNLFCEKINKINKRSVLSVLAKIYDPLGWLSPVIIVGKLFMQKLWLDEQKWDQELPVEDANYWESFLEKLKTLENIRIPRWLKMQTNALAQVHGFADASEKAYAAVVYAKIGCSVMIIASKSKVNPKKNRKTIPKLELCAAHLLAKLIDRVKEDLGDFAETYAWSDSTITLAWIRSGDNKNKFIRRRTDEIQKVKGVVWKHVRSEDNPADVASRGIGADKLKDCAIWWKGAEAKENWPTENQFENNTFVNTTVINDKKTIVQELLEKFSCIQKLERVLSYIFRFIEIKIKKKVFPGYLTVLELKSARNRIFKQQQAAQFISEINCLKNKKEIHIKSKILSLHPFLDNEGLLRVGGRLRNSSASFEVKHPIILNKCHISYLIIKKAHKETLHGGINLMRNYIQRKFWIFGLRNSLKQLLKECVTCSRYRQVTVEQIMEISRSTE